MQKETQPSSKSSADSGFFFQHTDISVKLETSSNQWDFSRVARLWSYHGLNPHNLISTTSRNPSEEVASIQLNNILQVHVANP